jgi:hypothetical protein
MIFLKRNRTSKINRNCCFFIYFSKTLKTSEGVACAVLRTIEWLLLSFCKKSRLDKNKMAAQPAAAVILLARQRRSC